MENDKQYYSIIFLKEETRNAATLLEVTFKLLQRVAGRLDRWMDRQPGGQPYSRKDGKLDGQTDQKMEESWKGGHTDERTD